MRLSRRAALTAGLSAAALPALSQSVGEGPLRPRRLVDRPIIAPGMDARMGRNIEGPSLIRTPDWLPNRLGRYYLYFADHKGDYIRLAYADSLEGPWRIHTPGSLQLAQTGLLTSPPSPPSGVDAAAMGRINAGGAPAEAQGIPSALENATVPHCASPDVHVDDTNQRIVMYFHGLVGFDVQRSRMAVSVDGVNFKNIGGELGSSYMRVFRHGGFVYAIAMPGLFLRSKDGLGGFEPGPRLFEQTQRHTAVLLRGDTLHIFWTRVGDAPERIYLSKIDLTPDWKAWKTTGPPVEVLRPERAWEGAALPVLPSYRSAVNIAVNQFRDPAIYEEGDRTYLLYAVQGEHGIGIAEITV